MSGWLVQAARDRGSSPEDNTDSETLLVRSLFYVLLFLNASECLSRVYFECIKVQELTLKQRFETDNSQVDLQRWNIGYFKH